MTIDRAVALEVQARLPATYRHLLQAMLDLGAPPIFLFHDERRRLVEVRDRAVACLDEWAVEDPTRVRELYDRLPAVLQLPEVSETLLEAAPWNDYFSVPESMLLPPDPHSRVFEAEPHLLMRLDDNGLLDVGGLDARAHGLFTGDFSLHYHQLLRPRFRFKYPLRADRDAPRTCI